MIAKRALKSFGVIVIIGALVAGAAGSSYASESMYDLLQRDGVIPHAGGTGLTAVRLRRIKGLMDLRRLPLSFFRSSGGEEGKSCALGAMLTYREAAEHIAKIDTSHVLVQALGGAASTPLRNRISLGGSIIKSEEVAPNMECAPCLLAPRLSEVKENRNIRVIANAEVKDVLGFYGNFTARIHKKANAVEESCIGCEACFEVCPVEVKSAFHNGLGTHKAVYTQFPGSVPAVAAIDKSACKHFVDNSCDKCVAACPAPLRRRT